jgi:hypothetical protein
MGDQVVAGEYAVGQHVLTVAVGDALGAVELDGIVALQAVAAGDGFGDEAHVAVEVERERLGHGSVASAAAAAPSTPVLRGPCATAAGRQAWEVCGTVRLLASLTRG